MDYYAVLGLDPTCSAEDIKKAYKQLALLYHPDKKTGNHERFQKINEAYQFLKDPERRKMYDSTFAPMMKDKSYVDILSLLLKLILDFMAKKQSEAASAHKKKDIKLLIHATLEEVYRGETKKIVVQTRNCEGKTVTKNIYIPLVDVESKYVFENQGDEYAPGKRNNIVIEMNIADAEIEGKLFKKDTVLFDYDLYLEDKMSLYEYYNGVTRRIKHIDGDVLEVSCTRDHGDDDSSYVFVHIVPEKGLPFTDEVTGQRRRGCLYLYFRLALPTHLPESTLEYIRNTF